MSSRCPTSAEDDEDLITGINITPMVDIMLVLLIIFMVTASFIIRPAIPITLPRAATAETATATLGISIRRDGELLLDGRQVNERTLLDELRRRRAARPELQAILAGDAAVPHGRVVRVIDILRRAGVTRIAINVQLEEQALEH